MCVFAFVIFFRKNILPRTLTLYSLQLIETLKEKQTELSIPDTDFVTTIWPGIMAMIDWNARPDQLESIVLREVDVRTLSFFSMGYSSFILIPLLENRSRP